MLVFLVALTLSHLSLSLESHVEDVIRRHKRFVNSQEYVSAKSVPQYLVRIVRVNYGTNTRSTICSGSIVSPELVLTSGGCLFEEWVNLERERKLIPVDELEIIAGDFDTTKAEATEQTRKPIQLFVHPDVGKVDFRNVWKNDVAIIKVDEMFGFNDYVGKVDLWLSYFAVNASYAEYYTPVKASGYGGPGSARSSPYSNLFDTRKTHTVTVPQYQFLAYSSTRDGRCFNKNSEVSEVVGDIVTLQPKSNHPNVPRRIYTGKRCFYTGSLELAGYLPTAGDYGGPITWTSLDNGHEYQVFLTPWQPELKSSFESGRNYYYWGELLSAYSHFIGKAFEDSDSVLKSKRSPTVTPTATKQQFTEDVSLEYYRNHEFNIKFDMSGVAKSRRVQVTVRLAGENSVNTLRDTQVFFRDPDSKHVLKHYTGSVRNQPGTVEIEAAGDGTQGRWGCSYKEGVLYTTPTANPGTTVIQSVPTTEPPTNEEVESVTQKEVLRTSFGSLFQWAGNTRHHQTRVSVSSTSFGSQKVGFPFLNYMIHKKRSVDETYYSCEDHEVNSVEGTLKTPASFTISSEWEEVLFNSTQPKGSVQLQILINRHSASQDRGTISLEVDYKLIDTVEEDTSPICDNMYKQCSDALSCVHEANICDTYRDCHNGVDEDIWCRKMQCLESEYMCSSGECIRLVRLCDGRCDCFDTDVCEDETMMCAKESLFKDLIMFGKAKAAELAGFAKSKKSLVKEEKLEISAGLKTTSETSLIISLLISILVYFS